MSLLGHSLPSFPGSFIHEGPRLAKSCNQDQGWSWLVTDPDKIKTMLYFIQEGGSGGSVKIGISVNPVRRMAKLQTGNSKKLRLLGACRGLVSDEKRLHRMFSDSHDRGEFFHLSDELVDLLKQWFGDEVEY